MKVSENPFRASLGSTPPLLVGREEVIDDFRLALSEGPGAHERVSLLVGGRGVGKTVLLNELEEVAHNQGWLTFSETATHGFVANLREQIADYLTRFEGNRGRTSWQLSVPYLSVKREGAKQKELPNSLRFLLTELLDRLEENDRFNETGTGVLITIDELHYVHQDEIIEFATTIQHLIRENREIAVVLAGIPTSIRPLLASDEGRNPITFLRRANRVDLGRLRDEEVEEGLSVPAQQAGLPWEDEALELAVTASGGYPFMIQLIGSYAWRHETGAAITYDSASKGITRARKQLGQLVHEPALNDLSAEDRRFLAAMSLDDGPSRITDIARRLEVSDQQAYNYRRRLYEADMVSNDRGMADFVLPYLREYLRDHFVADLLRIPDEK